MYAIYILDCVYKVSSIIYKKVYKLKNLKYSKIYKQIKSTAVNCQESYMYID